VGPKPEGKCLVCVRDWRCLHTIAMKFICPLSVVSPKFVLWVLAACALGGAQFFPDAASRALASGATNDALQLVDEKMSPERLYQFSFAAKAGQTYPIGVSSDMIYWSLLTNIVSGRGPLVFQDPDASKYQQRFYQIGVPFNPTNMVFIRPGTFTMGSPESEAGRVSTEGPQTVVTLTRAFWLGKFEVSQAEYMAVTGKNVSWFNYDPTLPADSVTWEMATNYCQQRTVQERAAGRLPAGVAYRLPTEAEWEYACRAGTTSPFGIGDSNSLN